MNNSMIGATAGASSPSKLAPETIRIRNALIEKYADKPIEELNKFLQNALEAEKDELKRLGLLAARVYILRQKVISLKAFIRDERMDKIPTPNLDKLRADGMRFTDAHTTSSVCTPTRYGILTGRYNWRSRLKKGVLFPPDISIMDPARKTIAGFLKDRGYRTCVVGKWHLGLNWHMLQTPAKATSN